MNKEEFKKLWESNDGIKITYNDIANLALEWGICYAPRCVPMNQLLFQVLSHANTNDHMNYEV